MPFDLLFCIISTMAITKEDKKQEEQRLHIAVVKQMLTLATSGFGLVAALAWNNLIQAFVNDYIKKYLPESAGIISLLIYSLIITALAVFITIQLSRLLRRLEALQNDSKKS
ncbi:MAG: hypothetical protein UT20_C0006G0017 [Candidatus Levybacteria bacterium GW2011_GWA1_39_11]|nr:MAG: hypothetical protein UT20_C0006G0017 [Candidatus Levybacteria bacterium GW2011_GWA1_39_11]